jgi:hypothetical protein
MGPDGPEQRIAWYEDAHFEGLEQDDLDAAEAEDTRHDPENWDTDESEAV